MPPRTHALAPPRVPAGRRIPLLIVASLAVKAGEIRAGLGRRSARFGINSAVSVVFLIGILAFVNYLGAQHVKRVDMTTEKIYSLSDQSVSVAQQLKQDLKIRAFYPGGEYAPAKDVLDLFKAKNNKISYEFIDPDKQPQIVQREEACSMLQSDCGKRNRDLDPL